jgi:hypothetical protein
MAGKFIPPTEKLWKVREEEKNGKEIIIVITLTINSNPRFNHLWEFNYISVSSEHECPD